MSTTKLYNIGFVSSATGGHISGSNIEGNWLGHDMTSLSSGQILQYCQDTAQWENVLPPLTYSIANVKLLSGQNLVLGKFKTGLKTDGNSRQVYIWQAYCCDSGANTKGDLVVQVLSGTTSVYKTSANTLQMGYPLAVTYGGNTTIRIMYSGVTEYGMVDSQLQYGNAMVNLSIY
jgi:hypothetical protein